MTKLKIPDGFTEPVITNLGVVYPIENGHINIPETFVHDGLFAQGFTVAPEQFEERPSTRTVRVASTETKAE